MSTGQERPAEGLFGRAVTGARWNFAAQVVQQVTRLGTVVVLGRLLTPGEFGLVTIATVVVGFAMLFNDLGTSAAVIQAREVAPPLLSTVFWTNVAFGMALLLLTLASAPLVAHVYAEPRLIPILGALAFAFPLASVHAIQKALLERNLVFNVTAMVETAAAVTGAAVAMAMAVAGLGVWALVGQHLAGLGVMAALYWAKSPWRPTTEFAWEELRRVRHLSLHLVGFNVVNYLARNADYLLIGRVLGSTPLGLYTLAYRIMLQPLQSVSLVIGRVLFPAYSVIQDDDERLRRAYLRTVPLVATVTLPILAGIGLVAGPFVRVAFGAQWEGAIPVLVILVPVGMFQSVATTVGPLYQAKGRTDLMFRWGLCA